MRWQDTPWPMGLIMLGTSYEKCVEEMLPYAREQAHVKIISVLAVGLALIFYRKKEEADDMIGSYSALS